MPPHPIFLYNPRCLCGADDAFFGHATHSALPYPISPPRISALCSPNDGPVVRTFPGYRTERVMTDNAGACRKSRLFAEALARIGSVHILTRPYRLQTNGKAERFHQTLMRGWAYKHAFTSSQQRR